MYVVIAGAGQVGRSIARALRTEDHDIVVVDKDRESLEQMARLDVLTVRGGAGSPEVLREAGIEKAGLFVAVTSDDEVNLLACSLAKSRNPKCRTIARVNGLDYMRQAVSEEYRGIGCDVAVCPELVAAIRIARILDIPSLVDADAFVQGRVQVVEARVHPGAKVAGRRIMDLKLPAGIRLAAVFREDEVIIPGGPDTLRPDDRLLAVTRDPALVSELDKLVGQAEELRTRGPVDHVLVVGATRVGVHLARVLSVNKTVVLIEQDLARCEEVSQELPKVTVIHGDAADRDTLVDEGIDKIDAVVGCGERDEFNILTCLMAKQLGVPRAITLVQQADLKNVAERIGIDLAVSPRQASIGAFLRYTHAHVPVKVYLLAQGEAQVLEFEVGAQSRLAGTKLRKAGFPRGSLVGAIVRGKEVLVPGGEDFLQAGDHVVVFTLTEVAPKIHRLFGG